MRIAYASDIHLEFDSSLALTGLSTADGLFLAGDVDTICRKSNIGRLLFQSGASHSTLKTQHLVS